MSTVAERLRPQSAVPCPWFESLPRLMRVPPYAWWIGLCSILTIAMAATARSRRGLVLELWLPALVMFGALWLSAAIIWSHRILLATVEQMHRISRKPKESRRWLSAYIRRIYSLTGFAIAGTTVAGFLVFLVGRSSQWLTYPDPWYESSFSRILFFVLWGVATWCAGAGLVAVVGTFAIPFRLSRDDLRLALHGDGAYGIKRVGGLYFKFALIISGAAFISVIGVVISPLKHDAALVLVYVVFSSISVLYFALTQWALHRALVREKSRLLDPIAQALEEGLERLDAADLPGEHLRGVTELLRTRREIESLSDWPLETSQVVRLLSASISPLLVILPKFWDLLFPAVKPHP